MKLPSVVGMFTVRCVCRVAVQLALAALRNRGDCLRGRVTRDKRDVSHVHVWLNKARLVQGRTTVAGYQAAPLAYTRCVGVTPCLTHGYLRVRVCRYNSRIMRHFTFNHLTPNGHYMGRTAQLTSRRYILYIYSTNIRTEYFKHAA